jgi:hypothetical protein
MAQGLIQSEQASQGRDDITPEKIQEGIQIPQEFQEAYERMVAAGMAMMFSKESNKAAIDSFMRIEGSTAQKLGQGIAGLLGMIVKSSNNTVPPQVIIPTGVTLLIQAADFMRKTKLAEINNAVIGDAMEVMITAVMEAGGLDVQKVAGFIEQKAGGAQAGGAPAPGAQPMMGA